MGNSNNHTECIMLDNYTNTDKYLVITFIDNSNNYVGLYEYYIDKSDSNYPELQKKVKDNHNKQVIITWHEKPLNKNKNVATNALIVLVGAHRKHMITNITVYSSEYTGTIANIVPLESDIYSSYKNYYELIFAKQKSGYIFAMEKKKKNECDKLGIESTDNVTIKYESMYNNIYVITDIEKH